MNDEDFAALERMAEEAVARTGTRLLSDCPMENHWTWSCGLGKTMSLSRLIGWLTRTHMQLWHAHRQSTGTGHVDQGRFKSFAVPDDDHILTVCWHVERNALRANLVERTETAALQEFAWERAA